MNHRRRRGFSMVMALTCAFLVGAALAVSGMFIADAGKRTRMAEQDAQLRQLLLAGEQIVQKHLPITATINVSLPAELKAQQAELSLTPTENSSATDQTIEVEASYSTHHLSQKLHFQKSETTWQLVEARLGE